mgnify:CR=1 FL=1
MKHRFFITTTVILLATSVIFGTILLRQNNEDVKEHQSPLLARRLYLENPSDTLINFQPLRKDVKNYLETSGLKYSFYFEYLFTGTSIRAGEQNKLVGASLMKIPIVMDLYKAAEQNKIDIDQEVTVPELAINNDPQYGNQGKLKAGDKITLREAAKITLVESDNTAAYTVFDATKNLLPPEDQAINNLDIDTEIGQSDKGKFALIDARSYSSFLKCLYLSCFVSPNSSEEILGFLTNSPDDDRIRAGLPSEVQVAHKIGSFSTITQSDCGIVYVPNRRYVLCIMLDTDEKTAAKHIKTLSEMAYKYVSSVNN